MCIIFLYRGTIPGRELYSRYFIVVFPLLDSSTAPVGYFTVSFVEKVPSRYTSSVIFAGGLDQEEVLSTRLDDRDRMDGIGESLIESPLFRIFKENPLQLGFYLESITTGNIANTVECFPG